VAPSATAAGVLYEIHTHFQHMIYHLIYDKTLAINNSNGAL